MQTKPKTLLTLQVVFVMLVFITTCGLLLIKPQRWGAWQFLIVKSGSMSPAIPTGSLIVSQRQAQYKVGDIVTFYAAADTQTLITHRILSEWADSSGKIFTTQGDANPGPDSQQVPSTAVLGKIVWVMPVLGYLLAWLQSPWGVVVLVVVPGTILVYEELKNIRSTVTQFMSTRRVLVFLVSLYLCTWVGATSAIYADQTTVESLAFSTGRWLTPSASKSISDHQLRLTVLNVGGFETIEYKVTYVHQTQDGELMEMAGDSYQKLADVNELHLEPLYLGSCSSDNVCTPHQQVSDVKVSFIASNSNGTHYQFSL